jgi:uncharacterized membrane protein YidH (DUF202 family)
MMKVASIVLTVLLIIWGFALSGMADVWYIYEFKYYQKYPRKKHTQQIILAIIFVILGTALACVIL